MNGDERPSTDQALAFIAANPHSFLLAQRGDGYPTAWAMMARVEGGAVEFSTYRASAKVRILLDAGVAGIVAAAEDPADPRVLVAGGPVELVEARQWVGEASGATSGNPTGSGAMSRQVPSSVSDKVRSRHDSGKRIVLRVALDQARFSTKARQP